MSCRKITPQDLTYSREVCKTAVVDETTGTRTPGYRAADDADAIVRRLRRVEGQVRGIAGMVQDGRYCVDVLQQISAAQAALDKVALALVDDHVRHCVMEADGADREAMRTELMTALTRMVGRR